MWYQITNLWNKGKYWIIAGAVAVLYILGYRRGKEKEQVKVMKGTVDNVKTAMFMVKKIHHLNLLDWLIWWVIRLSLSLQYQKPIIISMVC